jgi:hypothetical protein
MLPTGNLIPKSVVGVDLLVGIGRLVLFMESLLALRA